MQLTIPVLDPILVDTWYRCNAFKRYGKIYVYLNSVYIGSISTDVPIVGNTTTLYIQQNVAANPGGVNFTTYYDQFELHEHNTPAY